ncbi:hypothetical protein BDR03DRAFT_949122 [Suillus americanus]|nr:hypothetical protein BDR03DRAFT_949122 [Suillus americanus]
MPWAYLLSLMQRTWYLSTHALCSQCHICSVSAFIVHDASADNVHRFFRRRRGNKDTRKSPLRLAPAECKMRFEASPFPIRHNHTVCHRAETTDRPHLGFSLTRARLGHFVEKLIKVRSGPHSYSDPVTRLFDLV